MALVGGRTWYFVRRVDIRSIQLCFCAVACLGGPVLLGFGKMAL